ncbi:hypothetical protein SAMN03080617_03988 [Algoriphagus alkaliphilus]|uniref:Uncharacterized protein n=1 Tax=Algoriphagus alkaliphilus TaxID=279824 RepID=A0A1G5ZKA0_9BACT|nr:hypothetical protein [Algoriphagus alkaliphilus]SDA94990.1 hypothetical protein SAMN03080617_03988 [Algoriphagus alkaliphilus]
MPTLHSHTHCQVAPAQSQAKTWQRVCLSNRTTKTSDKPTDEKEHRSDNITYTQAGVSSFVGQESTIFEVQLFLGSSVVKIPACV